MVSPLQYIYFFILYQQRVLYYGGGGYLDRKKSVGQITLCVCVFWELTKVFGGVGSNQHTFPVRGTFSSVETSYVRGCGLVSGPFQWHYPVVVLQKKVRWFVYVFFCFFLIGRTLRRWFGMRNQ
jgi:hypothetical protein